MHTGPPTREGCRPLCTDTAELKGLFPRMAQHFAPHTGSHRVCTHQNGMYLVVPLMLTGIHPTGWPAVDPVGPPPIVTGTPPGGMLLS